MTLDAIEFIRRFAQHVLPKGFQKARYFALYATASRKKLIPKIAISLGQSAWNNTLRSVCQIIIAATGQNPNACPCCGAEKLVAFVILPIKTVSIIPNNINIITLQRPPPTIL